MNSIQRTARITGLLYFMMTPLGIFGIIFVPSFLIAAGNTVETINRILANEMIFRFSILSALILQVCNILIVLLLYKILKPAGKNAAVLMVVFLLVSVPITFVNEMNNFAALHLLKGADYLKGLGADQVHAQVMQYLSFHAQGIMIVSLFWGLWLLPMGYLVFRSGYIPRVLGILLIVTGVGYLIDFATFILFPDFKVTVSAYTGFFEIFFPLWLMIKGVNAEKWKKRALEN